MAPTAQRASRTTFVGRERELGLLSAALDAATDGHGTTLLVSGEPGIGKTRLVDEASSLARDAGMLVCWGRCWEAGGAPAFWPWLQIGRACGRAVGTDAAASLLGALAPESSSPAAGQSELARFALFDAVTNLLTELASSRPLLVVLDDLHAADPASLRLLHFVARAVRETRIVVVGTHREAELQQDAERARLLADVAREATEVPLRGLDAGAATALIECTGGARPSAELAASLHEVTCGNPFFLDELTRLMVAEDPAGWTDHEPPYSLPDRVRIAVRRRIDALPAESLAVLEVASVMGLAFDTRVLAHVLDLPEDDVVARLEAPDDADIVADVPDRPERRRFAHGLVREVLYDELPAVRRADLHGAIGDALEALVARRDTMLTSLANHYRLAGATERALDYAERAGRHALAHVAYEDAVVHLERALELLETSGAGGDRRRVGLLQALGDAKRYTGDVEGARQTLYEAALLARELGDAGLLARVVLAFGWSFELGRPEGERVALLEDAARGLGDERSALRARVLGVLAVALYWDPDARERVLELSGEAIALARETGDASTLGHALHCRRWVLGLELSPDDSLSASAEVLDLAEQGGDRELVVQCRRWRVADLLTLGDVDAAWREVDAHDALAEQLGLPLYRWYSAAWKATRALLDGRFEDAERDGATAYHIGARAEPENAQAAYVGHMHYVRLHQGRFEELLPALRVLAREGSPAPGFRAGLAGLLAEAGFDGEARALFDEFAVAGFPLPLEKGLPYALALLADACALLADAERAAVLYERIRPWAGRIIAVEPSFLIAGAADRSLGVLAACMQRWAAAENHFETALRLNERLRARAWVVRTQQEYAAMLLARDDADDRARAQRLVDAALASANELGMASVAARATRIREGLGEPPAPRNVARSAAESASLRNDGAFWTVDYRSRTIRLRLSTGLRYLARLLRNPGTEVHSLDLVTDGGVESGVVPVPDDTGPILDAQARTAYRLRLADLDSELADAESGNDLGRLERVRAEREALAGELAAAVGLGGRIRRTGSAAERARINVSRAIKTTLARIADAHPELGGHLSRTVRTGIYCSYQPDPRAPIEWAV